MILMHGNNKVALLEILDNKPIGYLTIYNKDDLPKGTIGANKQQERILFNKWYTSRCLPLGRIKADEYLQNLGITNNEAFCLSSGLSLTDSYWLKNSNQDITWEKINFHDNGFASVLGNYILFQNLKFSPSPDFTTDGIMEKFWYDLNGIPYLAKFDKQYNRTLIANEIIYSKVCNLYSINTVDYFDGLCEYDMFCSCKCFIDNPNEDFISAMQLKHSNFQYSGLNLLYSFEKLGFTKEIRNMISMDCLFHNVDRHEKNFGIIKNNSTNEIRFAPLYDNGYCLGANRNNNTKIVTDSDMKLLPESRKDMIKIIGNPKFDFDGTIIKQIIKEEYEKFAIPEIRYEIALSEIDYGLSLFIKENQFFIQSSSQENLELD